MTLARVHTWIAGEVLLASDLNAEFNSILNNPSSLFSPSSLTSPHPLSGAAVNEAQGTNIASASTTDIGAAVGNYVKVTGSTTITALGTIQAGTRRVVEFTGAPKITYNATSLILPGATDYYVGAGDVLTFISEGSGNWRCVSVMQANGVPSAYAGFKNLVGNGDMEVWQRGAGGSASISVAASATIGTAASMTADQWSLGTGANQASTVSQQTGLTNGSRFCARVQRNSGQTGIGNMLFVHALDSDAVVALRGATVTLTCRVRAGTNWSPASGTLAMSLVTGTGVPGYNSGAYTSSQTDIGNYSVNLTTSVALMIPPAATLRSTITQACIQFAWTPTGTASTNDYFEVDEVQLEIAAGPSTFDRRPFEADLGLCQRRFQKSFPYAVAPAQSGGVTGGVNVYTGTGVTGTNGATIILRPTMRITPTVITYNPSAGNANVRDTTNNADRTITVGTVSDASIPFSFAAAVAAATHVVHWTADSEIPT